MEGTAGGRLPDRLPDGPSLVAGEMVHHHHVLRCLPRHKEAFNINTKRILVDRSVENEGGINPADAQCGDEGHGAPMPVGGVSGQAIAPPCPTAQRCHVGLGPGLIYEDEPVRVDPLPVLLPTVPAPDHIRPQLLGRPQGSFLNEYPARRIAFRTVRQSTLTPRPADSPTSPRKVKEPLIRLRSQASCSPEIFRGRLPPGLPGVQLPVMRRRCDHFTTLDGSTSNAAASSRTAGPGQDAPLRAPAGPSKSVWPSPMRPIVALTN